MERETGLEPATSSLGSWHLILNTRTLGGLLIAENRGFENPSKLNGEPYDLVASAS